MMSSISEQSKRIRLFKRSSYETFFSIDIEFFVSQNDFGASMLSKTLSSVLRPLSFRIFLNNIGKIIDGISNEFAKDVSPVPFLPSRARMFFLRFYLCHNEKFS